MKNEAGQATWKQHSNIVNLQTGRSSQRKNIDELKNECLINGLTLFNIL